MFKVYVCVQEKTVTEEANFSLVARDFVDLVVKVCKSCDMHVTACQITAHLCVGCRHVCVGRSWIGQWQLSPLNT